MSLRTRSQFLNDTWENLNVTPIRLNLEDYDAAILVEDMHPCARKAMVLLYNAGSATRTEIEAVHPFAFNKGGTIECFIQLNYIAQVGEYFVVTSSGKDWARELMKQIELQPDFVDVRVY